MIRYSDVPNLVSLDFLRQIDRDPPGTWLAQKKIDGRRRMIYHTPKGWLYLAKNKGDAQPLPRELKEAFESLPWCGGEGFDCEWSGPRHAGGAHQLWIFDLFALEGDWIGTMPFRDRFGFLAAVCPVLFKLPFMHIPAADNIHLVKIKSNPGLVDMYAEQLTDPLSEGLVVRRADSKLIGSTKGCAVNPLWVKVKHREATKELP